MTIQKKFSLNNQLKATEKKFFICNRFKKALKIMLSGNRVVCSSDLSRKKKFSYFNGVILRQYGVISR